MKVGDRLYCYNNKFDGISISNGFIIGNYYIISDINMNAIYVEGILFWNSNNVEGYGIMYFGDYFYTLKELRKIKLDSFRRNKSLLERISLFVKIKKWFSV